MVKLFRLGIFALFVWSNGLWASTREEVFTSQRGGTPYLVAYEDPSGTSSLAPGIYVRADSKWRILLPGSTFLKPIAGGLSLELEMSELTERYEAAAIRNGRVTLFHVFSDESNPETYLELGGRHAVVDPLTGQEIQIPQIRHINDVTLYQSTEVDYQIVLVSIRSPGLPFGDGVTYAVVLDHQDNTQKGNPVLKPVYPPIVLDWKFASNPEELSRRLLSLNQVFVGFQSLNLLKQYARERPGDSAPLKKWREALGLLAYGSMDVEKLETEKDFDSESIPFLTARDHEIEILKVPSLEVDLFSESFRAVWDPTGKASGLYEAEGGLSLSDLAALPAVIRGEVAIDEDENIRIETLNSRAFQNEEAHVLHMKDGRLYLLLKHPKHGLDVLPIQTTDPDYRGDVPEEVAYSVVENTNLILVSWKFERQAFTDLYEIDVKGPHARIAQEAQLNERFFSQEELARRATLYSDVACFDDQTPDLASDEEYREQHRLTAPHIDLRATLKAEELKYYYPKPLSTVSLINGLEYREYESVKGVESRTGIYLERTPMGASEADEAEDSGDDKSKEARKFKDPLIRGEWIKAFPQSRSDGLLDEAKIKVGKEDDLHIGAILVDANHTHGKRSLFALYFKPGDSDIPASAHFLQSTPFLASNVQSFGFIIHSPKKDEGGKKEKEVKSEASKRIAFYYTLKGGGTFICEMSLQQPDKRWGYAVQNPLIRRVSETELQKAEILQRVLFDDFGKVFWVQTPEHERDSRKFRALRILDERVFCPAVEKSVELVSLNEEHETRHAPGALSETWLNYETQSVRDDKMRDRRTQLKAASEFKLDVFPNLAETLSQMANPERPPRHIVIIVPPELLKYVRDYPLAVRDRDENRLSGWVAGDPKHELILPNEEALKDQGDLLYNLDFFRERAHRRRPVLYIPLETVKSVNRPNIDSTTPEGDRYLLLEEKGVGGALAAFDTEKAHAANRKSERPHLLYVLANDGERVPLAQFRPEQRRKQTSVVMVGTEEQWQACLAEASWEQEYGLDRDFEVIRLEPPAAEVRAQFAIQNVLRNPTIASLGYAVELKGLVQPMAEDTLTASQAEEKLMLALAHRAEDLARENKMPVFESFLKVLAELENLLLNNKDIKLRRKINRAVIETALARLFPMPLNLSLLPENDPLRILSRDDADFLWLQSGSSLPIAFKERVLKTILSQLDTDTVRNVKSSIILLGGTGSGKTSAVKSLFKMLNQQSNGAFREYDFRATESQNQGSWAFFLPMNKILSGEKSGSTSTESMMTFDQAKRHFDAFLASENGARGFICFDDIHLAPDDVRAYFLARIRALQDEPTFTTAKGTKPTRNLTIIMTLNPTDNLDRIKKFSKNPWAPEMVDVLLATLSSGSGSNDIDRSFLARFSEPINLSFFPVNAKGPALLSILEDSRRAHFGNKQRVVFISPEAIADVIEAFPKVDARTFLSSASSSILRTPKGEMSRLFVVVPRRLNTNKAVSGASKDAMGNLAQGADAGLGEEFKFTGGDEGRAIEAFVNSRLMALSIDEGVSGRLEFTHYLAGNFRLKTFEFILKALSQDRMLMRNPTKRQLIVLPLSQSMGRHLIENPRPYLKEMVLDPTDYGVKGSTHKTQFSEVLRASIEVHRTKEGRIGLPSLGDPMGIQFTPDHTQVSPALAYSRSRILHETVESLVPWLQDFLMASLNLRGGDFGMSSQQWLQTKPLEEKAFENLGTGLTDKLNIYLSKIFDPRILAELQMTQYEAMRFFVIALDRAIHRLQWGKVQNFLIEALKEVSGDLTKGLAPDIQNLIFKSTRSPLVPADMDLVLGFASSMPLVAEQKEVEAAQAAQFTERCVPLLKTLSGGPS